MRFNLLLLSLLSTTACGTDTSPLSSEPAPQPRLERVGTAGAAVFDTAGYPAQIAAPGSMLLLTWDAGELRRAVAEDANHRVDATIMTLDGRITELHATCTGECARGESRHDRFGYGPSGNLVAWDLGDARRTYAYDVHDRLISIDDARGMAARFTYNADGCPRFAIDGERKVEYVYADDMRIAATADDKGVTGIDYNREGLISEFEGAAQSLVYTSGDGRGLDMWPGHYFGGSANGYPEHGELFHLDGYCDPSLTAQPTILALVVASLL
jgi:YD repeat-containing protein